MLNEYEKRFDFAKNNTDVPDYKRINEFKMHVNERIVKGETQWKYLQKQWKDSVKTVPKLR